MRHPLRRIPRVRLLQHAVDLFEGQALGFGDEHVGVDEAADAEGAPDEEDFGAEVALVRVDHVGGYDADDLEGWLVGISGMMGWGCDVRSSRASWRPWIERRREIGWEGGRLRR